MRILFESDDALHILHALRSMSVEDVLCISIVAGLDAEVILEMGCGMSEGRNRFCIKASRGT